MQKFDKAEVGPDEKNWWWWFFKGVAVELERLE